MSQTQTSQISKVNNITINPSIKQHVNVQVKTDINNKPHSLKVKNK